MQANTLELYKEATGADFERIKLYDTFTEMWTERSAEFAELTAITDDGKSYTFSELERGAAEFRAVLNAAVPEKSRVALLIPNSYEFVRAFIAVVTTGRTAVILPPHLDEMSVLGCCMKFGASALVTSAATSEKANLVAAKRPDIALLSAEEKSEQAAPATKCAAGDGCVIMFTGGTTGKSKGALLSNRAVMRGAVNSCLGVKDCFNQKYLLVLPLFHVFGLIRNLIASLYSGSNLFICRNNKDMFRDAAVFNPTIMVMVPALADMALTLSRKFGRNMLGNNLKVIICGAANVPPYLIEEYKKLGVELYPGYGLTESANLVSGNMKNHEKPGSVGPIFPGMEYEIVDGELWLKGDNMLDCYIGEDEPAYHDGWFRTGDLVKIDDEGFLYITGRIKEIIVLPSGENISPAELEAKFNVLPYIQDSQVFEDVLENGCHILALEVVPRAAEVAKLGDIDVPAFITGELEKINATLAPFERVSRIEIRKTDFERTPSMKIVRYKKC